MKYSHIFFWVLLLITLPAVSLQSQDRYNGPDKNDSFIPIGWSDDGSVFAYGWFETTQMVSNGSQMVIVIKEIAKNTIYYKDTNTWDEGNAGAGSEGYYPKSADEAWDQISEKTNGALEEFDIWGGTGAGLLDFPLINVRYNNCNNRRFSG